MFELLNQILVKMQLIHFNVLLLLGMALFGGTVGGRLFQKLKIPQVVGYIVIGIFLGESGLKIVNHDVIETLQPFNYFALGLIGFMIGGELKKDILIKYGKQLMSILLFEGIAAFLSVTFFIGIVGGLLFGDYRLSWSLGLLLGAIASATAPATTTEVLKEYKTRGPLTRTILGIVALDDALALLLFAFAASIAGSLMNTGHESILKVFMQPLYVIGGAVGIGIIAGLILSNLLKKYSEAPRLLAFSIGIVLLVVGLSLTLGVDMLLAAMTLGVMVSNFVPKKSKETFKLVEGFTPPIYVLFFVLVGAKFNVSHITGPIIILGIVYLVSRTAGKSIGSYIGSRISGAPITIQKYLPLCLLTQAGVAIGLSILASHYFPGYIGNTIVVIITATTLILELVGPTLVKLAVTRAGEAGLNITEEEIIQYSRVEEFMDKKSPTIHENMHLTALLKLFSESDNLYYPVTNENRELKGIITVENLRKTFLDMDLNELLLAVDIMEPVIATTSSKSTVAEARAILHRYNIDYLPVVDENDVLEGFIERQKLNRFVTTQIIEVQKKADSLG